MAAERFRARSGQTHRPWEIRARGGTTAQRVAELDRAAAAVPLAGEPDLQSVAATACAALASVPGADVPLSRAR